MESDSEELVVVGHKTEKNVMEDFWMARVSILEKQYDEHISNLEKRLFENKFYSRITKSEVEEKESLKEQVKYNSKKKKILGKQVVTLKGKLEQNEKEKMAAEENLRKTQEENSNLSKTIQDQRSTLRKVGKTATFLGHMLSRVEMEKKRLAHDVSIRESELKHWRESESRDTAKQKTRFPIISGGSASSTGAGTPSENQTLLQNKMNRLIQNSLLQEDRLLEMRRYLEDVEKQLENGSAQLEKADREKLRIQNNLLNAKEEMSRTMTKLNHQKQLTENWREEVQFRNARLKAEVTRNETSGLRGQVASLTAQLRCLEKDRERFLEDRSKLTLKLQGLNSLEKSLSQLIRDNVRTRDHILRRLEAQEDTLRSLVPSNNHKRKNNSATVGYDKQINRLEKKMKDIEMQLTSARRRENSLRWELQRQTSTLVSQIHWTNKARFKVEAQNRETEKICNSWARQISQKGFPVSNPCSENMERKMKERILQKRLLAQNSKLEKMRTQLHYRTAKQNLSRFESPSIPLDSELWKWNNFAESTQSQKSEHSNSNGEGHIVAKRKEFIQNLGESIATLGNELNLIERKQAFLAPLQRPEPDQDDAEETAILHQINSLDDAQSLQSSPEEDEDEEEEEEEEESLVVSSNSTNNSSSHSTKESSQVE